MSMANESDFEAQLRADGFTEIETQSLEPRPGKGAHLPLPPGELGGIDQLGEGRERRLAPSGFIGADHTLCNTRPEGQFRLRHSRTDASPPQQAPGRSIHPIHQAIIADCR